MTLKDKEELDRWRMGERPARQRQPRDHRHKTETTLRREVPVAEA